MRLIFIKCYNLLLTFELTLDLSYVFIGARYIFSSGRSIVFSPKKAIFLEEFATVGVLCTYLCMNLF